MNLIQLQTSYTYNFFTIKSTHPHISKLLLWSSSTGNMFTSSNWRRLKQVNTLTFKYVFLSGFLHRHELSIDLQHTLIWEGQACYAAVRRHRRLHGDRLPWFSLMVNTFSATQQLCHQLHFYRSKQKWNEMVLILISLYYNSISRSTTNVFTKVLWHCLPLLPVCGWHLQELERSSVGYVGWKQTTVTSQV